MTIEQYFSMMQQSVTDMWKNHLSANNNDVHVILNDFYDDALEQVDAIIETYMGIHGKLELEYSDSPLDATYFETPLNYLIEFRKQIIDNKSLLGDDSEVLSDLDTFLSTIDSTIYKLRDLCGLKQSNSTYKFENSKYIMNYDEFLIVEGKKDEFGYLDTAWNRFWHKNKTELAAERRKFDAEWKERDAQFKKKQQEEEQQREQQREEYKKKM